MVRDTFRSPSRIHSCLRVDTPIVAMVNNPTHLQLTTAPKLSPVSARYVHQCRLKGPLSGLPAECDLTRGRLSSLQNMHQKRVERPVKKRSGLSRGICLDWVMRPFSNKTRTDARREVEAEQSSARRVRYAIGTSPMPSVAGTRRIMT